MRHILIPILILLSLPLGAQRYYSDELSAAREENRRLKAENEFLRQKVAFLEKSAVQDYWKDLSGLENDEAPVSFGLGQRHSGLSPEDEELNEKLIQAAPGIAIPFREEQRDFVLFYAQTKRVQMRSILKRYDRHREEFATVFAKYGVPEELLPLAIVESAVSPNAVSSAGAVGVWQLMRDTAEEYGLVIDDAADDRTNIGKSTDAAARYLRSLYRTFGDWRLAVLSYNCGPGALRKAIILNGGKQDFWSVYEYLPRETRGYLLSLIAVCYVEKNRELLENAI